MDSSGLQVSPEIAGLFAQIPLNNDFLVPYDDLQAAGGYGRKLILPDDIIPTMGLVTLTGSKNGAKLWTDKNVDGAADVFVVGQTGGGSGGGITPAAMTDDSAYVNTSITGGRTDIANFGTDAGEYLYGASFGIHVTGSGLSVAQFKLAELAMYVIGSGSFIRLVSIPIWFAPAPPTPDWLWREVYFPVPMNIAESCGAPVTSCTFGVLAQTWADHCCVSMKTGSPQT